ncbi:hypothetical protein EVAR_52572_1 [Eumeta japonica]|uniref:Uncharacterized protein n=1 Tax=Eumeta variegata TaxID=151549 RepID=A0A4C1YFL8_EUMVA|nr:hypothetical protein EVAR_52572_1 [Eumeta japonica]
MGVQSHCKALRSKPPLGWIFQSILEGQKGTQVAGSDHRHPCTFAISEGSPTRFGLTERNRISVWERIVGGGADSRNSYSLDGTELWNLVLHVCENVISHYPISLLQPSRPQHGATTSK